MEEGVRMSTAEERNLIAHLDLERNRQEDAAREYLLDVYLDYRCEYENPRYVHHLLRGFRMAHNYGAYPDSHIEKSYLEKAAKRFAKKGYPTMYAGWIAEK
jgi:hypothetical protein